MQHAALVVLDLLHHLAQLAHQGVGERQRQFEAGEDGGYLLAQLDDRLAGGDQKFRPSVFAFPVPAVVDKIVVRVLNSFPGLFAGVYFTAEIKPVGPYVMPVGLENFALKVLEVVAYAADIGVFQGLFT